MVKGKVYLIGAGPGKPDLITVRGLNILRQAEVVIYDYLVDKSILNGANPAAELVCSDELGKGRYADGFSDAQERINRLMVKKAKIGKKVVRLKNGDPMIFGRMAEEARALTAAGIEFEIVPGVTAASAAAAYSGVSLTNRNYASSVIFVTGHEAENKKSGAVNWQKIAPLPSIVLYMAVENLASIAEKLILAGKNKNTPAIVISEIGNFKQKMVKGALGNIAERTKENKLPAPAIVIIGEGIRLEKDFNWFRKNKRILFTGLSEERFFMPGSYFHLPLIKIEPLLNYDKFDAQLRKIKEFNWLIFASRYGVEYFFRRLNLIGDDARILSGIKIAVVGNSTRERLLDFGVKADFMPREESSAGLLKEIKKFNLRGKKIFMPRSNLADKGLTEGFKKLGAIITSEIAYRNVMPDNLPDVDLDFFDEIVFTSPSAVRNFKQRYGNVPKGVKIRWIGEVTRREV